MTTEKPLRILHCFRSPVGGVFRHVRDLVEEHVKLGHEVGILCDSSTGGEHEEKLFEQIKPMLSLGLIRLPIGRSVGPSDLGALWKAYQHIKSLQPDVIHGHSAKGGVLARLIGSALRVNRYRVARLYSPHGGSLHYDRKSLRGQVFFNVERLLERFTDALCFVCHYEQSAYTQKVGKPHTQARMIYNGVQESEFAPVPLNANASHFLYIGMLRDLKGPDVFIDAFTQAEKLSGQTLTGVIVGDGPERDKYRDAIAAAGLSDRLVMHPIHAGPQGICFGGYGRCPLTGRIPALHHSGSTGGRQTGDCLTGWWHFRDHGRTEPGTGHGWRCNKPGADHGSQLASP
jgi:glycosyltransferase involved in cell wall biosynthesis